MMNPMQVSHYAHALHRALGPRAEAEAARRARETAARGQVDEAEDWRAIRAAIHQSRGPRMT